jgi:hypothetical protein
LKVLQNSAQGLERSDYLGLTSKYSFRPEGAAQYDTRREIEPVHMKLSFENACVPRRVKVLALCVAICFPLYLLSTGPIAWATNDGLHPRYLPEEVNMIYLPLAPMMRVQWIDRAFYYYTAVLWGGYPAGYTTL